MASSKYYVYGGGRWRELDTVTGRVSGWRGARLCVARRGKLAVRTGEGRRRLLAALRELATGAPSGTCSAREGPRLPLKPLRKKKARTRSRSRTSAHCQCCCCHNNNRCDGKSLDVPERSDACIQTAEPSPSPRANIAFSIRQPLGSPQKRNTSTPITDTAKAVKRPNESKSVTGWKRSPVVNDSKTPIEETSKKSNTSVERRHRSSSDWKRSSNENDSTTTVEESNKKNSSVKRRHSSSDSSDSIIDAISQSILKRAYNNKYLRPRKSARGVCPSEDRPPQIRTRVIPGKISISSDDENKDPAENFPLKTLQVQQKTSSDRRQDKKEMYRELVISDEDVDVLRRYMMKVDPQFDLYRYDNEDEYKAKFFYSINPLVSIEVCPKIVQMLENVSLQRFASQLGLRSVSEGGSSTDPRPPPRKRRRATVIYSQEDTDDSEDKENFETTSFRRRSRRNNNINTGNRKKLVEETRNHDNRKKEHSRNIEEKINKKEEESTSKKVEHSKSKGDDNNKKYDDSNKKEHSRNKENKTREKEENISKKEENSKKKDNINKNLHNNSKQEHSKNKEKNSNKKESINMEKESFNEEENNINIKIAKNAKGKYMIKNRKDVNKKQDNHIMNGESSSEEEEHSRKEDKSINKMKEFTVNIEEMKDNNNSLKLRRRKETDDESREESKVQQNNKKINNENNDYKKTNVVIKRNNIRDNKQEYNGKQQDNNKQVTSKIPNSINNSLMSKEYSSLEDHAIVAWISVGDRANLVNGNKVWRQLEQSFEQIAGRFRSWHSLRNRYLRHLLPSLGKMELPPSQQVKLRAAAAEGEIKKKQFKRNSMFKEPVRGASSRKPRADSSPVRQSPVRKSPRKTPKKVYKSESGSSESEPEPARRSPRYSEVTRQFAARHQVSSSSEFETPKSPIQSVNGISLRHSLRLRPQSEQSLRNSPRLQSQSEQSLRHSPRLHSQSERLRSRKLYNPNKL